MSFLQDKIFILKGQVQHYAWGGYSFIPNWLGVDNAALEPYAEYWMGAHATASSLLCTKNGELSLHNLIADQPKEFIGEKVYEQFGELPYLFKILDVKEMLSIQVHPTKENAQIGFDEEEAAGILVSASNRNYKDKNHKPEVMIALSEFWLLHGFLPQEKLQQVLTETAEFAALQSVFDSEGYKGLYQHVMEMPQADVNNLLLPLVQRELEKKQRNELTKQQPGWWVAKLFTDINEIKNIDRGVFSIYFFNIVQAEKGEAVFQSAGIPHAYLEGQNVELMANSDNVLRGGLTPKHVDTNELLKHIHFEGIVPRKLKGDAVDEHEKKFACPVPDFGIAELTLNTHAKHIAHTHSLEIWVIMEGALQLQGTNFLEAKKGQAVAILPNEKFEVTATENSLIYKAFVP